MSTTQFQDHRRSYHELKYLYPVMSRRARGLSIGVNLNPDKVCNWDCPYCQVDRTTPPAVTKVDEEELYAETRAILDDVVSGALWEHPRFSSTPEHLRRLRDIALAGDGEPTSYKYFSRVIENLVRIKSDLGFDRVRINVLTNASLFHLPHVREGLRILGETRSDIWCKLDAGTEEYYQEVNRSKFSLEHCRDNILWLAQQRAVTIQSMFMRYHGQPPSEAEIQAYIDSLRAMVAKGARFRLIQIYTIARMPSDAECEPLSDAEIDALVTKVRFAIPEFDVQGFYGKTPSA